MLRKKYGLTVQVTGSLHRGPGVSCCVFACALGEMIAASSHSHHNWMHEIMQDIISSDEPEPKF